MLSSFRGTPQVPLPIKDPAPPKSSASHCRGGGRMTFNPSALPSQNSFMKNCFQLFDLKKLFLRIYG